MAFENLTDRERQVLLNLITHYIASADPVGSRVIANRFKMGLSSATIRNTLQDLEEMGLVEQPHTSAGRVPTDSGYRVYVDYLIKPERLSAAEQEVIKQTLLREGRGVTEILGQAARVLGEVSSHLGISLAPKFDSGVLSGLRLIPVADDRIMMVVIVESGFARSVILEVEGRIADSAVPEVEAILNERLSGLTLSEIRRSISERLADIPKAGRLIKLIIDSKDRVWTEERQENLHYSGADRLLTQPEFADPARLSALMRLFEHNRELQEFLSQASEEGLVITIGRENRLDEIMNCSLVTSTYKAGSITGTVGVMGPTRMPYSKLVSVVEYTARSISEILTGMDSARTEV